MKNLIKKLIMLIKTLNKLKFIKGYMHNFKIQRKNFKYISEQVAKNYQKLFKLQKKPIIFFSSCCEKGENGDAEYNGGIKLQNLWVKLLRKNGYQAYRVTRDGTYQEWLIDHQPHLSLQELRETIKKNKDFRFVTTWLKSYDFLNTINEDFYYFDAELAYSRRNHYPTLKSLLPRIEKIGTHSRSQQSWYMERFNIKPSYIPEWSDSEYWSATSEKFEENLVGYMKEGEGTESEIEEIREICTNKNLPVKFIRIKGSERQVISEMRKCDIFLGMNKGKDILWGEGCPRTQQETMHAGCVVIAYDVNGNKEYLTDEFSGFLVPCGRSDLMAERLVKILRNRSLKESIRKKSKLVANKAFTERGRLKLIEDFLDLKKSNYIFSNKKQLEVFLQSPVFLTNPEIRILSKYANKIEAGERIVEIGSAFGASTVVLMLHKQPKSRLISIDPFVKDSSGNFQAKPSICKKNVKKATKIVGNPKLYSTWKLYQEYSYEVSEKFHKTINLCFIDGDHSYKSVKKDVHDWLPKIKTGGYLLLHDSRMKKNKGNSYSRGLPGPTKVKNELLNNHECVKNIENTNSISVWKKIKSNCNIY